MTNNLAPSLGIKPQARFLAPELYYSRSRNSTYNIAGRLQLHAMTLSVKVLEFIDIGCDDSSLP